MSALKNILKALKTTAIGIGLIVVTVAAHYNGIHSFDLFSLIVMLVGVIFLFSPDTILNALPRIVDAVINTLGGTNNKDKDDNNINITFNRNKER